MKRSEKHLLASSLALAALLLLGTFSYFVLGAGRWSLWESFYMTVITLATVGYGELPGMDHVPYARGFTIVLIGFSITFLAYFQATITALLVEGVLGQAFRRNRMRKTVEAMKNHVVVAGAGSTGKHVIEELYATKVPFVVIDKSMELLGRINADLCNGNMLYVHGDATDDHVLLEAGVARARGVVAALTHDRDNLFVTLSARSLNATARIVSKVVEDATAPKLIKAGANSTVSPTAMGGQRMASELIRPEVNEFLDQMLRDKDKNLRLEEVVIPANSRFVGHKLEETPFHGKVRVLIVAIRGADRRFHYNPEIVHRLEANCTVVVFGPTDAVAQLRQLVNQ